MIRNLTPSRSVMLVMGIAYGIFALSLLFQGARWGATPAYHNLLEIMRQPEWGGTFALSSGLLLAAFRWHAKRWLSILALTAGIALTSGWALAFVVRWATSPNTTPETWVSWAVFDYLFFRAAWRLDVEEVIIPRREREC